MASTCLTLSSYAFTELRFDEIYNFWNTSCQLKVILSNEYNTVYVQFHKFTSYVNPMILEETKTHNFVNYPLVAI